MRRISNTQRWVLYDLHNGALLYCSPERVELRKPRHKEGITIRWDTFDFLDRNLFIKLIRFNEKKVCVFGLTQKGRDAL